MSKLADTKFEKPIRWDEGQPRMEWKTAFIPYTPDDMREMTLREMLNIQLGMFTENRSLPCYKQGLMKDCLKLAENQNRVVTEIARCLVTAAKTGETLDGFDPQKILSQLACEMSFHARRIYDYAISVDYGYEFYFNSSHLLSSILTTIRRLKITRQNIVDGKTAAAPKAHEKATASPEKKQAEPEITAPYQADTAYGVIPEATQKTAGEKSKSPTAQEGNAQKNLPAGSEKRPLTVEQECALFSPPLLKPLIPPPIDLASALFPNPRKELQKSLLYHWETASPSGPQKRR